MRPLVDPGHGPNHEGTSTRPPGAVRQVAAVLAFRREADRGRDSGRRRAVRAGVALLPAAAVVSGLSLPSEGGSAALALMPTAWLGVIAASTLAAATGGGGRALLPPGQTEAFPLSPAADHLGATLLAPVNIAWIAQAVGLLLLTAWATGASWNLPWPLLLTALWLLFATCVGQSLGWLVEVARTSRAGTWALGGALAAAVGGGAAVMLGGHTVALLQRSPTVALVTRTLAASPSTPIPTAVTVLTMLAATAAVWAAGVPLVATLRRRPARSQSRVEARTYPPRPDPRGIYTAMLRIDQASVWRSVPLRRGLMALSLLPITAALGAGLDWSLACILPGLVAAGAGLLFGVNAWCLDDSGAVWRESLPTDPRLQMAARLTVVAQMCLIGAALTAVAAAVRSPGAPTAAEATAVVGATLVTTAQVVGRCATWSVRHPHAAALRDSRDQPAPPAVMAGYAARLALVTTITSLCFGALAQMGSSAVVLSATAALLLTSARRIAVALRLWNDPAIRARVVMTVIG